MSRATGRALVLGGGGVTGIAWMAGLMAGMAETGWTVQFDKIIGTSAGAAVGGQLAAGHSPADLFARQIDPALQIPELKPSFPIGLFLRHGPGILLAGTRKKLRLQRIGAMALAAGSRVATDRRAVIAARLGQEEWPEADFTCTAIDADTGELALFDKHSGAGFVDAVAASCAVPGIWPVQRINGRDYYDGGLRSSENADLAKACSEVLILSPMTRKAPSKALAEQIDQLQAAGARVRLIFPDPATAAAMGRNMLNPANREPAARAALIQGRATDHSGFA